MGKLNTLADSFFDDDDFHIHLTAQPTSTSPATESASTTLESPPTKVEEATASLTSAGPTTTDPIPTTTSEPRPKHEALHGNSPGHTNTGSGRTSSKPSAQYKGEFRSDIEEGIGSNNIIGRHRHSTK